MCTLTRKTCQVGRRVEITQDVPIDTYVDVQTIDASWAKDVTEHIITT